MKPAGSALRGKSWIIEEEDFQNCGNDHRISDKQFCCEDEALQYNEVSKCQTYILFDDSLSLTIPVRCLTLRYYLQHNKQHLHFKCLSFFELSFHLHNTMA